MGAYPSSAAPGPAALAFKEIEMKKTVLKLACAVALLALSAFMPAPASAGKCATCPELLQSCKSFCGSNNVVFNCQNHNPCAGTCTCG
jgi:hypothetical protein